VRRRARTSIALPLPPPNLRLTEASGCQCCGAVTAGLPSTPARTNHPGYWKFGFAAVGLLPLIRHRRVKGITRHPAEIFYECGGRMTLLARGGVNFGYVAAGK